MKALRIHTPGSLDDIFYEEIPRPQPQAGEVLVQVYASGLTPMEITWATSTGQLRPLPATLGFEVSGVIRALGEGVEGLSIGSAVYGMPDFRHGGTQAEYVTVKAGEVAPKPVSLTHNEASGVPLSGLTAWQALFDQANLKAGQTILIHGAAGGVGVYAVQLAKWAGAKVITTATRRNHTFLTELGASKVIDYNLSRFEDMVREVDVVLDTIGGNSLENSWRVLKNGGILVSIADVSIDDLQTKAAWWGVRANWFLVQPSRDQLIRLGKLIDAGKLKTQIEAVFPLSQALKAYKEGLKGHNRGKLVLQIVP